MPRWHHGPRRIKPTWQMLRARDPTCWICGDWVEPEDASVDHIWPTSRGGPDTVLNVALAHRDCNSRRGAPYPTPELIAWLYRAWGWHPVSPMGWVCPDLARIVASLPD